MDDTFNKPQPKNKGIGKKTGRVVNPIELVPLIDLRHGSTSSSVVSSLALDSRTTSASSLASTEFSPSHTRSGAEYGVPHFKKVDGKHVVIPNLGASEESIFKQDTGFRGWTQGETQFGNPSSESGENLFPQNEGLRRRRPFDTIIPMEIEEGQHDTPARRPGKRPIAAAPKHGIGSLATGGSSLAETGANVASNIGLGLADLVHHHMQGGSMKWQSYEEDKMDYIKAAAERNLKAAEYHKEMERQHTAKMNGMEAIKLTEHRNKNKSAIENVHQRYTEYDKSHKQHQQPGVPEPMEMESGYPELIAPGFNYLGPGNQDMSKNPTNMVDAAAREHDLAYNNAKTSKDVANADDAFLSAMGEHVLAGLTGKNSLIQTAGAVVGGLGIGAKRVVENVIGVQYPSVDMPEVKSMFGIDKNGKNLNANQWLFGLNRGAKNKGLTGEAYDTYVRAAHNKLVSEFGSEEYNKNFKPTWKAFHLNKPEENQEAFDEFTPTLQHEFDLSFDETLLDSPTNAPTTSNSDRRENVIVPETPETPGSQGTADMSFDTPPNSGRRNGPAGGSEATTGGAVTGGAGVSLQAPTFFKARGYISEGDTKSYHNCFRIRAYGNALFEDTITARTATVAGEKGLVFPWVMLPVEYLSFFCPESFHNYLSEFPCAEIESIHVQVTPCGQMVDFTTLSVQTSAGTTAHTLYGSHAVGLNKQLPLRMVSITRNESAPMTLSSVQAATNIDPFVERLWGTRRPYGLTAESMGNNIAAASNTGGIIFPHTYTEVLEGPPKMTDGTGTRQTSIYPTSLGSWLPLSQYFEYYPLQPMTGKKIIDYSYTFPTDKRLRIGGVSWNLHSQIATARGVYLGPVEMLRRFKLKNDMINIASRDNNLDSVTNTAFAMTSARNAQAYKDIKLGEVNNNFLLMNQGKNCHDAIPSIHFGVEAVRANVPEANVDTFINASCDYKVETLIIFKVKDHGMLYNYNPLNNAGEIFLPSHLFSGVPIDGANGITNKVDSPLFNGKYTN